MSVLPPRDLLERVDGVTKTLQRGQRLRAVGWAAFVLSLAEVSMLVFTSDWWSVFSTLSWNRLDENWLVVLATLLVIVSFLLINWTRFWVRESRQPFRYTLSVDDFGTIGALELPTRLCWLRDDLAARLNERIPRLSLLDPRISPKGEAGESHVHVGGTLGFRRDAEGQFSIEVFPWLRLGPATEAANLAHPVRFALREGLQELADDALPGSYEKLVERIYFSIASQLYRQIREDVENKISLLPRRYFRAAAYYHEAKDYLRSNTLDAFTEAQRLFDAVVDLYEPRWEEAESWPLRHLRRLDSLASRWSLRWRRKLAEWRPSFGEIELMVVRSKLGAADTLLYRRTLAKLSGRRLNAVFAARPLAEDALAQAEKLPAEVPGRSDALFDAHVTRASSLAALNAESDAELELEKAQRLDPRRAENDSRFLYVRGLTATQGAYQYFRRAIDSDQFFEAAQFQFAVELEMIWRRRATLERTVARIVLDAYEAVLKLNPGNLAAWANIGYVYWLLGEKEDLERAKLALDRGREYKELTRETFVAELDYVLARIEAERGDFEAAYKVYIASVNAQLAEGVSHAVDRPTTYHFAAMSRGILSRFEEYEETVRKAWQAQRGDRTTARVHNSVYGFVLNDYGEACMNYFLRTGEEQFLDRAQTAFSRAQRSLTTRYPVIHYNLHLLERLRTRVPEWHYLEWLDLKTLSDEELLRSAAIYEWRPTVNQDHIKRALVYEPLWADAILEHALLHVNLARQERRLARVFERLTEACVLRKMVHESKLRETKDEPPHDGVTGERVLVRSHGHLMQVVGEAQDRSKAEAQPLVERFLEDAAREASEVPPFPTANVVVVEQQGETVTDSRGEARSRARALKDAARRLRFSASNLRQNAESNEAAAAKHARRLVQHNWAWSDSSELPQLPPRIAERDLDDVHARALLVVCMSALEREGLAGEAETLLHALLDRFLPGDFGALLDYWETFGNAKNAPYSDRLADLVARWIKREPAYRSLPWLDRGFVSPEVRTRLLGGVLYERNVPEEAFIFVGERLTSLTRQTDESEALDVDAGAAAFRMAGRSRDPAILRALARRLASQEKWPLAARALRRARALTPDETSEARAGILLDLAIALWHTGRGAAAMSELRAVGEMRDAIWLNWRHDVAQRLIPTVDSATSYRMLKDWLGHELTAAHGSHSEILYDAASALMEVTAACYHGLARRRLSVSLGWPSEPQPPRRILIEADPGLFPREGSEEVRRLLNEQIPELRKVLRAETGIVLPAVAPIQSSELLTADGSYDAAYCIRLDGILVCEGHFTPDQSAYVPREEADIRRLEGSTDLDPLGREILWIDASGEGKTRHDYVLAHLEAIIRQHLDRLVGYDQVLQILEAWEDEVQDQPARAQLRRRALPDANARQLLVASIRALAAEHIPPRHIEPVLATLVELGPNATVDDVVEGARRRLAPNLPGAADPSSLQPLAPDVEDEIEKWVHTTDSGTSFLALPEADLDRLRAAVAGSFPVAGDSGGVLVLRRGLRPFVRKIAAFENPGVAVLGRLELGKAGLPPRTDRSAGDALKVS